MTAWSSACMLRCLPLEYSVAICGYRVPHVHRSWMCWGLVLLSAYCRSLLGLFQMMLSNTRSCYVTGMAYNLNVDVGCSSVLISAVLRDGALFEVSCALITEVESAVTGYVFGSSAFFSYTVRYCMVENARRGEGLLVNLC
jgi:hypothetical protein